MMIQAKVPCYGCNDRTAECHPTCERYKEYLKWHGELKHKEFINRMEGSQARQFGKESIIKARKRKNK